MKFSASKILPKIFKKEQFSFFLSAGSDLSFILFVVYWLINKILVHQIGQAGHCTSIFILFHLVVVKIDRSMVYCTSPPTTPKPSKLNWLAVLLSLAETNTRQFYLSFVITKSKLYSRVIISSGDAGKAENVMSYCVVNA